MAIPMCDGRRHIFIVSHEHCRCDAAEAVDLDPRETRISGVVTRETWSTVFGRSKAIADIVRLVGRVEQMIAHLFESADAYLDQRLFLR